MQIAHKKDVPSELTVVIEKLSNLGYGIARHNGYVIFVENACPEDKVKIRLTKKNKSYGNAVITEIVEPSPHRIEPICPMQKVCGACQLGFIDYNYQLKIKKQIVQDLFRDTAIEIKDTIPSPQTLNYRHKIQYPVSETKDSKRILAGYFKAGSHEIVNIKYCPVQPDYCDKIIEFIREHAPAYNISGYKEKTHSGDLRHVLIRTSKFSGKSLIILVINSAEIPNNAKELASKIYKELPSIAGVGINLNLQRTNIILGKKTIILYGESYIEEKLCDKIFKVGAETFFQVNPSCANEIFNYVKNYISKNFKKPLILDAYAGITAFGICLSDIAEKVVSVEEVKLSVDLAAQIVKENNIKNIELHNSDASKFFESELKSYKSFDVTILDPPRKGCSQESLDYAMKLTNSTIIYVSCNPATLARDLKYLTSKGCTVDSIQPFDMFPHTYHIENVAVINVK